MSTEQRRIMLTEADDGHWTAREEPGGLTAHGETPEAALGALDDANEPDIDPDAPCFRANRSLVSRWATNLSMTCYTALSKLLIMNPMPNMVHEQRRASGSPIVH